MFTSKEPGQFPRDPEPYVLTLPYVTPRRAARVTFTGEQGGARVEFAPRPEFNTEANPILRDFRVILGLPSPRVNTTQTLAEHWLECEDCMEYDSPTTTQLNHARKVLTRLAALTEGGTNENG